MQLETNVGLNESFHLARYLKPWETLGKICWMERNLKRWEMRATSKGYIRDTSESVWTNEAM